jgi:hypothetical protein
MFELRWDARSDGLTANPTPELELLRNATLVANHTATVPAGGAVTMPVDPRAPAAMDVLVSFDVGAEVTELDCRGGGLSIEAMTPPSDSTTAWQVTATGHGVRLSRVPGIGVAC